MAPTARQALVDAARSLIVARGYADTSVEDVCSAAGVSKGAFFHHFRSKDDVASAAIAAFVEDTVAWQAGAPGASDPDPLARAVAFVDHNIRFIEDAPPEPFGCILGNVASELAETRPELRKAAAEGMRRWAAPLARDLAAAAAQRGVDVDAQELALHFMDAFQGGVVRGRAENDPSRLAASLRHYRAYLLAVLGQPGPGPEAGGRGARAKRPKDAPRRRPRP